MGLDKGPVSGRTLGLDRGLSLDLDNGPIVDWTLACSTKKMGHILGWASGLDSAPRLVRLWSLLGLQNGPHFGQDNGPKFGPDFRYLG